MRLLQITHLPVYPPKRGGDHRKHGIVTDFVTNGDTVDRFSQAAYLDDYTDLELTKQVRIEDFYTEYNYMNPLYSLHRLFLLFDLPYLYRGLPLRIWLPRRLHNLMERADVILVEEPWQVPAIQHHAEETPVVYSSHNVESAKFQPDQYPLFGTQLQTILKRIERKAVEESDMLVCVSEDDEETFKREFGASCPTLVAPNGIYASSIRTQNVEGHEEVRERHGIDDEFVGLFVGANYGPNIDAVQQTIDMMDDFSSDFHLLIVGSVADEISCSRPDVTFTGFVDDIEPYYDVADVGLNPMRIGGGTNIKLLDYFARSLPVISTPFGMRGFDNSSDVCLVSELPSFPEAVSRLRQDDSLSETLAANGREFVKNSYTWERVSSLVRDGLKADFGI